jgi:hypothetical protein
MKYALNSRAMPLGTIKAEQWDDIFSAIDYWIRMGKGGYAIDSADHLLQRLVYEHAVQSPHLVSFKKRAVMLVEAQRIILQSWLDASKNNKSQLALERAEKAFVRLLELRGRLSPPQPSSEEQPFPIEQFQILINGWLHLGTNEGAEHAANLLLAFSKEEKNMKDAAPMLIPSFQEALLQCCDVEGNNHESAFELLERIEILKQKPEWQEMELPEVVRKVMLEASIKEGAEPSDFETDSRHLRIIELVQIAGTADISVVDNVVETLPRESANPDLCTALTDFYIRVRDAQKATQWLQRLDNAATSLSKSKNMSTVRFHQVLTAWRESNDRQAPWRAEEIVRRMHDLEDSNTADIVVSAMTYNILFKTWQDSGDPSRERKVQEGFSRMIRMNKEPDAALIKILLNSLSQDQKDGAVESIVGALLQHWGSFQKDVIPELVEAAMEAMAGHKVPASLVHKVLILTTKTGAAITKEACRNSLLVIRETTQKPSETMELISLLEQSGAKLDLSCYQIAIQSLFKFEKAAVDDIESIFSRLLLDQESSSSPEKFGEILLEILAFFTSRKWYNEAEHVLVQAENALLSKSPLGHSPVPLACYERMMHRNWYTPSNSSRTIATFHRLMSFYHAGYLDLLPNQEILGCYMKAIAQTMDNPGDVEKSLDEIISLISSTGDTSCKLDVGVFNTVLGTWRQETEAGTRSISLFRRMLSLGVQPDTMTINFVMQNVMKSGKDDRYSTVADLFEQFHVQHVQPDSRSLHVLLDACSTARNEDQELALRTCLETLGRIRQLDGGVRLVTYKSLTNVLRRLFPQRGKRSDKVVASVFLLCCEDGMLSRPLQGHFKSLLTTSARTQVYTSRLVEGKEAPEWSRHVPKEEQGGQATRRAA